jgi:glyoxylase-like metal-dependent hydrolase (beta-lactamase superfamily II)
MKTNATIHTLDLNFRGIPNAIAAYLIPHAHGVVLVECGPGSTLEALQKGLAKHNFTPRDISDVLLTHIHLDHAGAAGWLARHGARVHVHHVGAPHMLDPSKLLHSASRIYGDRMDQLWGEFLPVPPDQTVILHDNDEIEIEGLVFRALDTPGHAYHHMAYLFGDTCFSGDVGGVRIPPSGSSHIRIPAVPPEFHLEKWRQSINRLQGESFTRIAPTHFGIYERAEVHLAAVLDSLDDIQTWMENTMPKDLPIEALRQKFVAWAKERSMQAGLESDYLDAFEAANPSGMSADGIQRYWRKFCVDEF